MQDKVVWTKWLLSQMKKKTENRQFKCGRFRHCMSDCPGKKDDKESPKNQQSETQKALITMHVALAVLKIEINPMWILCDNE